MRHFSEDELRRLIRRAEDQHLELKGSLRDRRTAAKELASLANSGRGLLVVGVREGRDPIGIPDLDGELRLLEEGRSSISPPLSVDVSTPQLDGRQLIVAEVQGGDGPYVSPDGAIVRRGRKGSTVALSRDELRKVLGREGDERVLGLLEDLNRQLHDEAARAENERQAAGYARSWRGQWHGWLISAAIGAVLGFALTAIFA